MDVFYLATWVSGLVSSTALGRGKGSADIIHKMELVSKSPSPQIAGYEIRLYKYYIQCKVSFLLLDRHIHFTLEKLHKSEMVFLLNCRYELLKQCPLLKKAH